MIPITLDEPPTKDKCQFDEPTITLFNKRHDINKFNKIPNPERDDDEEESISFIKPKDDLPENSFPSKGYLKPAEKSKLQLMMSWLSGDLSDDEDEVDAEKICEKRADDTAVEKSSLANSAETLTTKTSTTASFSVLPTISSTNILSQATVNTTTAPSLSSTSVTAPETNASMIPSFTVTTPMFTVPKSGKSSDTKPDPPKLLETSAFNTASTEIASHQLEKNANPTAIIPSNNQTPPKNTLSFGLTKSLVNPVSANTTTSTPSNNTTTSMLTITSPTSTSTSTSTGHRLGGFSFSATATTPTIVSAQKDLSPTKSVLTSASSAAIQTTQHENTIVSSAPTGAIFSANKIADSEVAAAKPIFSFGSSSGSTVMQSQSPSASLNFGQQQKNPSIVGSVSSPLTSNKPITSMVFSTGQSKTEQPSQPINSSSGPTNTSAASSTTSNAQLFTFGNQTAVSPSNSSKSQTAFSFGNQVVPSLTSSNFGANEPVSQTSNSFASTLTSPTNVFNNLGSNKPTVFPAFGRTQSIMQKSNISTTSASAQGPSPTSSNVESRNVFGIQYSKSPVFSNTTVQSQTSAVFNVFGSSSAVVTTSSSTLLGGIKTNTDLDNSTTANTATVMPFRFGSENDTAVKQSLPANVFSMPTKSNQHQQSQPISAQQSVFSFGLKQSESQPQPNAFQASTSQAPSAKTSNLFTLGGSTHTKLTTPPLFGNSSASTSSAFEPTKPFAFGTTNNNTNQQSLSTNVFSGAATSTHQAFGFPTPPAFASLASPAFASSVSSQFSFGATSSPQTTASPNLGVASPIQPVGNNPFNPVTPPSGARRIRQATRRFNK